MTDIGKHSQFKNTNNINKKELDARNPNTNEIYEIIENHTNKKPEIMDEDTHSIQKLINQLINNTGIIESVNLKFKKTLSPKILLILSTQETLLTKSNIRWEINFYEKYIELKIEQKKI